MNGLQVDAVEGLADILGVRFHRLSREQAVERILHWVADRTRRMVITAGPEFVMMTRRDEALGRLAQAADLVTPDGIGIVWAARRLGRPVQERVAGVELVETLMDVAEHRKQPLRVFMLGAEQTSLDSALMKFRQRYPSMEFEGHDGYFSPQDAPSIIQQVAEFQPDVWLVGLGQPRQEKFIFSELAKLPPCVAIGIGGSIDVWGGTVKRAPVWVRKLNLEWLYRLLSQPQRWKRQLVLPKFAWQVLRNSATRT